MSRGRRTEETNHPREVIEAALAHVVQNRGKGRSNYFSELPSDFNLPIVDKRKEIEIFDVDQGYRSIGIIRPSHPSAK